MQATFRVLLVLTLLSSITVGAPKYGKAKIYLKWLHQYQFAGYYVALEKGFFKDEGIDVELIERDPKQFPLDEMIKSEGLYAVSDSSIVLHYLDNKPVLIISAIFQHSPLVFATSKASGIKGPLDLKNKKVMYQVGQDDATVTAMFNNVGLTKNDYTAVKHKFNMNPLYNNEVDAISIYYTNQPFEMNQKGFEYNIIDPGNYGVDFYGDLFVTTTMEAEKHPERVAAMERAVTKGWTYALENLEESISITKKYSPKNPKLVEYEANATKKMVRPDIVDIGTISVARLERIALIYRDQGMTKNQKDLNYLLYSNYIHAKSFEGLLEKWWKHIFTLIAIIFSALGIYSFFISRKLKKQSRELIMMGEMKEKFFSSITHELRTPLNGIIVMSENLVNNPSKKEVKEGIDLILYSSKILLEIINDILDFSKIAAKKLEIKNRPFKLFTVLDSVKKVFTYMAENKGIDFNVKCNLDNDILINSDDIRILQIVNNLLSNAFKFTESGYVELNVKVETKANIAHTIITVEDTGSGIKDEQLEFLFHPFSQLEQSNEIAKKGTGLGLSITKELVDMFGGTISVQSVIDKGTQFKVELPLQIETTEHPLILNTEDDDKIYGETANIKTMIIDDNQINLTVLEKTLKKIGITNITSHLDPVKAFEEIESAEFDLIITDLHMPNLNGKDLLEKIRLHSNPKVSRIFSVLSTAGNQNEDEEYINDGFNYHLQKPIQVKEIIKLINYYNSIQLSKSA